MPQLDLILTLTGGLSAALALGYVTHRLGLSPIVGYLLAGIAVSPHTPGFVADHDMAEQLAEIGVVLLMFGVGLQFHLDDLLAVRRIAVPGAVVQSLVATGLGALVARGFGWDWTAGIVFGLAISVASTVVLIRVLADNRDLHTRKGHIAVGWLVVEDIFTVLVLVLMPVLFGDSRAAAGGLLAVGWALLKIGLLVGITFVAGGRVIPWLLERIAATRSRELFTLTILVVALGIAVLAAGLFDVSMALGAFLAGMVVGRSEFSFRAASEALPMRDAFAVLFFVSVGMLFEPAQLLSAPGLVASTLAVILLGKPLAALAIVLLFGYPPGVALSVAVALAQIGEFSFILATVGNELGVLPPAGMNALVAAAIISITLNTIAYRFLRSFEAYAAARSPLWRKLSAATAPFEAGKAVIGGESRSSPRHRAIVVGYGPSGRTLTRILRENGVEPTVIEMNLDTVRRLRAEETPAVYGDVTQAETLKGAGIADAGSLILSAAGLEGSESVIRLARELNPDIQILARSTYLRELPSLRQAGADSAYSGEGEVALALSEAVLRRLGATPEQLDRERERVRADLFGSKDGVPGGDPTQTGAREPVAAERLPG
jgi:CPA2 family monovalent cation:H+ antiporter-2